MAIRNVHLGIRVTENIKEKLEHYARKEWLTVSDLVRRGVKHELEQMKEKHVKDRLTKWSV